MKKTIRTLSMVMMTLAMALCFLFAGLAFVKADTLPSVDLYAINGAEVYTADTVEDTGIRYTAKIKKSDYIALTGGQEETRGETDVHLGVRVGRYNADGEFTVLDSYIVNTNGVLYEDGDYYTYTFAVKYNLSNIFADYTGTAAEKATLVNRIYSDELAIQPFYRLLTADGANIWDATPGESRSMLHVAQAELADPESKLADKEAFAAKYIAGTVYSDEEIEIRADGSVVGNLAVDENSPVTFTIGTNARVVARVKAGTDAVVADPAAIAQNAEGKIQLFGYTADRKVIVYNNASYVGLEGVVTTKLYDDIMYSIDADKFYFNGSIIGESEIYTIITEDGQSVYLNGKFNPEGLALAEGITMYFLTDTGIYEVDDVKVYTKVFENNRESRIDLVNTFHTPAAKTVDDERKTITGAYALAENIYFDHKAYDAEGNVIEGKYSNVEAFANHNTDIKLEDGSKVYVDPNTFAGIFDGRGYTLNDVLLQNMSYNSMFGKAGDGAVLKNFAINNVYVYVNEDRVGDGFGMYAAVLFNKIESAEAAVTFENLYVYRYVSSSSRYYGIISYNDDGNNSFGKSTFKNVIMRTLCDSEEYVNDSTKYTQIFGGIAKKGNMTLTDSYFISNSRICTSSTTVSGITKYSTMADFKAATNDYSTFDNGYWTMEDGIPVWGTLTTTVALKNSDNEKTYEINSITAGEKFTISVKELGVNVTENATISTSGAEVIEVSGGVITVKAGVVGEATITVSYKGNVLATYNVSVDTVDFVEKDVEVLLSALDGKIYFNGIKDLEGAEVVEAYYNEESIVVDGKIDTTAIRAAADIRANVDVPVTLKVKTSTGAKYELTNVKLYSGVFDNSLESKQLMSRTFGTSNDSKDKKANLEGYFVLAENITFYDAEDTTTDYSTMVFGGTSTYGVNIFNAVFNGRGYAMRNIIMDHSGSYCYGMFGNIMGGDAELRNFAIENVLFRNKDGVVSGSKSASYYSLLFSNSNYSAFREENKTVMSNVYITATWDLGNMRFFYNTKAVISDAADGASTGRVISIGFNEFNNVYVNYNLTTTADHHIIGNDSLGKDNTDGVLGVSFNNTYFVTNSYLWAGVKAGTALTGFSGLERYTTSAKMAEAYTDGKYDAMVESGFWAVQKGLPVWKSLATIATLTDSEGNVVSSVDTDKIGETYSIAVEANGSAVASGYEITNAGDAVVSIDGNKITTLANANGTAIINVTYNEQVIATYNIKVNTMPIVTLTGPNGDATSISSEIANEEYSVSAVSGGAPVAITLDIEGDNVVEIVGNTIKTKANVAGSAVIVVKAGEVEIARYNVTVNTRAVVTLTDKTGAPIEAIESFDKDDIFTVTAIAGGVNVPVSLEVVGSVVTADGNKISVVANVIGSATIKVFVEGELIISYEATVDTVAYVSVDYEVLLSAYDDRFYFNETDLAGATVTEAIYNDASIMTADGKINTTAIRADEDIRANADTAVTVKITTSVGNKYELNNVKLYTAVFENEQTSRLALRDLFSYYGRIRGYSGYVWSEKNYGYYALAENLTFDLSNIPTTIEEGAAKFNPENKDLKVWAQEAPYELFFNAGAVAQANDFGGVFDGRGYSMNNIGLLGNMFGEAQDGAVIKNVAFNGFTKFEAAKAGTSDWSKVYYNVVGGGTNSKIFSAVASADASVTFENVYIKDEMTGDSSDYSSILFYSGFTDADSVKHHGNLTFNNIIIENTKGPALMGSTGYLTALNDTDSAINAYVIAPSANTAPVSRGGLTANSRGENVIMYLSYDKMREANNDYTGFTSNYWTIVDGVPVWTTCLTYATLADSEGNAVESITESGAYTAKVVANGKVVEKDITTSCESEYVTCNGANIVVGGEGVQFSATVNVYYKQALVATFEVIVDNRVATPVAEEILISKENGKMFLNGTSFANDENFVVEAATYNDASVYADGVIDVAAIDVAVNTAFTLNVTTTDAKYTFTNVKMYDRVFENTVDSRRAFVTLLKGTADTTLTGYYVLAENLTFDITSSKETFASSKHIYDATFDGRGYALVDINLASGSFFGMFGNVPGENAVLKNFAINGIYHNKTLTTSYEGLFFSQGSVNNDEVNNTLTMSNVYIYRKIESTPNSNSCNVLTYNRADQLTLNMSNVIIEIEMITDADKLVNFAGGKPLGTATDTYFLINGRACGAASYRTGPEGTVYYGAVEDADLSVARAAMVAANNDYTTFKTSGFWTVAEGGVPVWTSIIAD